MTVVIQTDAQRTIFFGALDGTDLTYSRQILRGILLNA
jgi:hypothetical protein